MPVSPALMSLESRTMRTGLLAVSCSCLWGGIAGAANAADVVARVDRVFAQAWAVGKLAVAPDIDDAGWEWPRRAS